MDFDILLGGYSFVDQEVLHFVSVVSEKFYIFFVGLGVGRDGAVSIEELKDYI